MKPNDLSNFWERSRSELAETRPDPALETGLKEHLDLAHVAQEQARGTQNHKEAVQAFLEKRRPEFKGR